jgi:hypothetical protein
MKRLHKTIATIALTLLASSCAGGPAGTVQKYTLDVCVVSDNKLGSMGDPITRVYGNQEIKFCCKPCIKEFEKEKDRYLKKLAR